MKHCEQMELIIVLLVFCLSPLTVHSHGNMMLPTTWFDAGGKIGMRNQMLCGGVFSPCLWFTNFTFIPGKPTLDPSLWTYSKMFSLNEPTFNLHDLDYDSCQHKPTKSFLKIAKKESPPIIPYTSKRNVPYQLCFAKMVKTLKL